MKQGNPSGVIIIMIMIMIMIMIIIMIMIMIIKVPKVRKYRRTLLDAINLSSGDSNIGTHYFR